VNLAEYMLPTDKFYTYPGSLTTPGCAECVVWLVLDEPLLISGQAVSGYCHMFILYTF